MAKGDMPNASVGIGYNPNAAGAGPMNPNMPTGRMQFNNPAPPVMGGSAPMNPGQGMGIGMSQGGSIGPNPQLLSALMAKFTGMGTMPQGMPFRPMPQPGMQAPSAPPMPRPGGVGPSFASGSTYNRPQVERTRARE